MKLSRCKITYHCRYKILSRLTHILNVLRSEQYIKRFSLSTVKHYNTAIDFRVIKRCLSQSRNRASPPSPSPPPPSKLYHALKNWLHSTFYNENTTPKRRRRRSESNNKRKKEKYLPGEDFLHRLSQLATRRVTAIEINVITRRGRRRRNEKYDVIAKINIKKV